MTDYGDENPLLMDYYGMSPELYKLQFSSRGDATLSRRVLELFHQVLYLSLSPLSLLPVRRLSKTIVRDPRQAGIRARLTTRDEVRGADGRGFAGPGMDHGVFVPFRLMFGEEFRSVPIVQASIDGSLSPESNWNLGKAIAKLRCVQRDFTTRRWFFVFISVFTGRLSLSCLPLGRKAS